MLKFPYAICDFHKLITGNYFYADRTACLPLLEDAGDHLLFLRPRRFGKSLLLSMLENYYDMAKADEFEKLFGHLAIGKQPTSKHNQYFVLKWDFSGVKPTGDIHDMEQNLDEYINARIDDFARYYQSFLARTITINPRNAMVSFQSLLTAIRNTPYKLYLLIDEYDNFANELMMAPPNATLNREATLRAGEGVLKVVLKVVKAASAGGGLDRAFLTGISPVILTDITSGYNIARNIYLHRKFHDLCGFTEMEMATVLTQLGQECGWSPDTVTEALATMRQFYNGYRFSEESQEQVYNPTMVLYFLQSLQEECQVPSRLLDSNLLMDQNKLTFLSHLPGGEKILGSALGEHPRLTLPELIDRFSVEDFLKPTLEPTRIISLLYYFGILTLTGPSEFGRVRLTIPNLAVRKLYVDQLRERLLPGASSEVAELAYTCYRTGELQPLCHFVEQRYFKVLDNRDLSSANELTLKLAFLTLLFNDQVYIMDSETALERGYADLTMRVREEARGAGFWDFLFEFKFVNLKSAKSSKQSKLTGKTVKQMTEEDLKTRCQSPLTEAREQLQRYRQTLIETYGEKLRLKMFAVVAVGWERIVWEEV